MAQFMTSYLGGMQGAFAQPENLQWTITPQERSTYENLFTSLQPKAGFLHGDQTKNFFLQSNLPAQILKQIWQLADITEDGKMDKLEFSIAMKLIKLSLHGVALSAFLPARIKQLYFENYEIDPVAANSATVLQRSSYGNDLSSSPLNMEWSVPNQSQLKYAELFNATTGTYKGCLTNAQARQIFNETGLPQATLAKIWKLSDVDNDGKLSQDEFIVAMYLVDIAKGGNTLPPMLPTLLIPPSYRNPSQALQSTTVGQSSVLSPCSKTDLDLKFNAPDPCDAKSPTSFEDKRRENFRKGSIELEKRRLALLESQRKETERLEQKEKEERERKEKEKVEQQRRRQKDLQDKLEKQREEEREQEEQERKVVQKKEAAQREMERQRQLEWERLRRNELLQTKMKEQKVVMNLQAKCKTMDMEFNSHEEKHSQLLERVRSVENRVKEQSQQLVIVNKQRDFALSLVQKQQEELKAYHHQLNDLHVEKISLNEKIQLIGKDSADNKSQAQASDHQSRSIAIQGLRDQLEKTTTEKSMLLHQLDQLNSELHFLRADLNEQKRQLERMNHIQQDKITVLKEAKKQKDLSSKTGLTEENVGLIPIRHHEMFGTDTSLQRQNSEAKTNLESIVSENKAQEKTLSAEEDQSASKKLMIANTPLQQEVMQRVFSAVSPTAASPEQTTMPKERVQPIISKDPNHLVKYCVMYDFAARNLDELSINTGDTILVDASQNIESDWLAGSKDGRSGWFPANHAKKLPGTGRPGSPPPRPSRPPNAKMSGEANQSRSHTLMLSPEKLVSFSSTNSQSTSNLTKPPKVAQRYKAIYPWIARKETHLSFDKDDVVAVSLKQEAWWFGHCKGNSGWFPRSYVIEMNSTAPVNLNTLPASPRSSPIAKRRAPQPPVAGSSSTKRYLASYDFEGTQKGDLTFKVGDIILVTSNDGDWWTGTLNGKRGIFPANYVTLHKVKQAQPKTPADTPELASVIAAFRAAGPEQLSLQVGQVVLVRKKVESGWWEGELQVNL